MIKKIISIVLAFSLVCVGMISTSAVVISDELKTYANSLYTYKDFSYSPLENGTVSIIGYSGSSETLEIPSKINGKTVSEINFRAFSGRLKLKSVVLNKGLEK